MILSQLYYILTYFFLIFISSFFIGFDKLIYHFWVPILLSIIIRKYFFEFRIQLYFLSILYFVISSLIYFNLFKVNEWGFFANFDDSFYFFQGKSFLEPNYKFDTIFEIIIWFFQKIGMNDNYTLSTINLFLSILTLGVIGKFSRLINNRFKGNYLYLIGLNAYFIECTVALYRDMLGLFFILISFILIKYNRKFLLPLVLSFFVRSINPFIILSYYMFNKLHYIRGNYKGKSFTLFFIFFIIFYIFKYLPMDFLGRDGIYSGMTISEVNQSRNEVFFGDDPKDLTSKLISYGFLAAPLVLLLNIFSPLRVGDLFVDKDFNYLVDGVLIFTSIDNFLNYTVIFQILHVSMVMFLILSFFSGFYEMLVKERKHVEILLFLFLLVFVSFVSFQPRHKLYFLIFLPLICSYNTIKPKDFFHYGLILEIVYFILLLVTNLVGI